MKLTLIQPAIGRRIGQPYIRSWQVESLSAATLAGLTPADVAVSFYDDRLESIPFDEPTDLVAITMETYAAKRSYQIASEYRRRGVPVVVGGFHPTLWPEEAARYAESVMVGEAEDLWASVIDDFRHGRLAKMYRASSRPSLRGLKPNREIFRGKTYLPIGLVETARGCPQHCEFCAVQSAFHSTQTFRPIDEIVAEIASLRQEKKFFFFVNDNFAAQIPLAKELCRALIPLKVRWVSQASIHMAFDEEFLDLMARSGCQAVLMGFESLNPSSLARMNKNFNRMEGGVEQALKNLRRVGIRVYGTFIFGYDEDNPQDFAQALDLSLRHRFYLAAFAHLMPFPGTPLYERFQKEGRLRFKEWWLEDQYRFNMVPYHPRQMPAEELERRCLETRQSFYRWTSIARRGMDRVNGSNGFMFRNFFVLNAMHRADVYWRHHYPLGDESWRGPLLPVR